MSQRVLQLIKLARPRTWCFIVAMFIFAYASSGPVDTLPFVAGILVFIGMTAASNLVNAWTDQVADRINLPHRQVWLDHIGPRWLLGAIVLCYLVQLGGAWLMGGAAVPWVYLGAAISLAYSLGPRLKAHPLFSLVAFATGVTVPWLAGWSINQPFWTVGPILLVLAYFFFAYGTLKNIPDIEGDRAAGARTIFTMFPLATATRVAAVLLVSPYLLLVLMVALGALPLQLLLALAFLPLLVFLLVKTARAHSADEREATHALGYFYQLGFFIVVLLLYWPSPLTFAASAALAAVALLADGLKIDSRPYDLRWARLFSLETPRAA